MKDLRIESFNNIPSNCRSSQKQDSLCSLLHLFFTIDSVKDFEDLLNAFPNDPWLHKFFADLLERDESFYAAADAYGTAAKFFIEADMRPCKPLNPKPLNGESLDCLIVRGKTFIHPFMKPDLKVQGCRIFHQNDIS